MSVKLTKLTATGRTMSRPPQSTRLAGQPGEQGGAAADEHVHELEAAQHGQVQHDRRGRRGPAVSTGRCQGQAVVGADEQQEAAQVANVPGGVEEQAGDQQPPRPPPPRQAPVDEGDQQEEDGEGRRGECDGSPLVRGPASSRSSGRAPDASKPAGRRTWHSGGQRAASPARGKGEHEGGAWRRRGCGSAEAWRSACWSACWASSSCFASIPCGPLTRGRC